MSKWIVVFAMFIASTFAFADGTTPVGLWKTIDDKTKQPRSLVRITENSGAYEGKVEKIFPREGDDPAHLCKECKGDRKDQPIIGMTILWNLKVDGKEFTGGEILDPKDGKIYRCKMTVIEDGKKLNVRGFIGISLLGRTQTWVREE